MNNKGFTLVELLATISLLAVLMLIAVPNIIGVVNKNKNKTYVEDAKKLVALAEYKVRAVSTYKPGNGSYKCITMNELGTGDFDTTAPNGGKYDSNLSYVRVSMTNDGSLEYKVTIVEKKNDNTYIGILKETNENELYKDETAVLISSSNNSIKKCQ